METGIEIEQNEIIQVRSNQKSIYFVCGLSIVKIKALECCCSGLDTIGTSHAHSNFSRYAIVYIDLTLVLVLVLPHDIQYIELSI